MVGVASELGVRVSRRRWLLVGIAAASQVQLLLACWSVAGGAVWWRIPLFSSIGMAATMGFSWLRWGPPWHR